MTNVMGFLKKKQIADLEPFFVGRYHEVTDEGKAT